MRTKVRCPNCIHCAAFNKAIKSEEAIAVTTYACRECVLRTRFNIKAYRRIKEDWHEAYRITRTKSDWNLYHSAKSSEWYYRIKLKNDVAMEKVRERRRQTYADKKKWAAINKQYYLNNPDYVKAIQADYQKRKRFQLQLLTQLLNHGFTHDACMKQGVPRCLSKTFSWDTKPE